MLDLRRSTRALRAALPALAALFALALTSAANADTTGELAAFGGADGFTYSGPLAVDPSDGDSIYVADFDVSGADPVPQIRKYSGDGTLKATLKPPASDGHGGTAWVEALAVDPVSDRLYVLQAAQGADAAHSGAPAAMVLRAYSTTPSGSTLVAASGVPANAVLADFTAGAASAMVDNPTGLAVDPTDHRVVILGVADPDAASPKSVLQYLTAAGAASTRKVGLGAPLDVLGLTGVAAGPDGALFLVAPDGVDTSVFRVPAGGGTATKVATDPAANNPGPLPGGFQSGFGLGSRVAVSADGATVYVAEGNGAPGTGKVRGFAVADGRQTVVYGGGTTACAIANPNGGLSVAAGSGGRVVTLDFAIGTAAGDKPIHVFGSGGTGCPRAQALFTVAGKGDGTITVTKGAPTELDASMSDLLGGTPSQVDWDLDGSGQFATHVTGSPASLKTSHRFLVPGTYHVGVRIHVAGGPDVDPVFHDVKVVPATPVAAFKASTRTPGAGAAVTFDASDSVDPAGSPTGGPSHTLATYRWDFGDGQSVETTTATVTHAFANGGTGALSRTVKLVVVSADGVSSVAAQQTLTVAGTPAGEPQPQPQPQPKPNPPGGGAPKPPAPAAPVLGGPSVDAKGASVTLKVTCPAASAACAGTLRLTAKVKTKVKGKTKTRTITLGTASFSVSAGKSQAVKVKLSSAGRALLRKQRRLSASAAVTPAGGTTKTTALTLKVPAKK